MLRRNWLIVALLIVIAILISMLFLCCHKQCPPPPAPKPILSFVTTKGIEYHIAKAGDTIQWIGDPGITSFTIDFKVNNNVCSATERTKTSDAATDKSPAILTCTLKANLNGSVHYDIYPCSNPNVDDCPKPNVEHINPKDYTDPGNKPCNGCSGVTSGPGNDKHRHKPAKPASPTSTLRIPQEHDVEVTCDAPNTLVIEDRNSGAAGSVINQGDFIEWTLNDANAYGLKISFDSPSPCADGSDPSPIPEKATSPFVDSCFMPNVGTYKYKVVSLNGNGCKEAYGSITVDKVPGPIKK